MGANLGNSGRNRRNGRTQPFAEINITPMVDVMLVLLVTLIVSLPLMTHAVKLNVGQSPPAAEVTPPEVVELDIDFDGAIEWNGTVVSSTAWMVPSSVLAVTTRPSPMRSMAWW